MRDDDDGFALLLEIPDPDVAFFLEGLIAHGQHLVDEDDIGLAVDGRGEGQPEVHAGGEILELHVLELLQLGKFEDVIIDGIGLPAAHAQDGGIDEDVLRRRQLGLEAHAQLQEGGNLTIHDYRAAVGVHHTGQHLEQCGLARAVAADDAEGLAPADFKADIPERPELLVIFLVVEKPDALLQHRRPPLVRYAEQLGYVIYRYRLRGIIFLQSHGVKPAFAISHLRTFVNIFVASH